MRLRQTGLKWIGAALSLCTLGVLASKVDTRHLTDALAQANLLVLAPAVLLYFGGVWVRSLRWQLLLPPGPDAATLFRALVVGFSVNNLLPARLGEVARAYLLKRWANVPYSVTLASLVAERVLDGLCLAALLLGSLAFLPLAPSYLVFVGTFVGLGFCGGAVVLGVVLWQPPALRNFGRLALQRLPSRVTPRITAVAAGFDQGFSPLRSWRRLMTIGVLSLVGWASELGLFYALLIGFQLSASIPLAFVTGAAANFATLVPSSPGYVGTFDAVVVKVLVDASGVSSDVAAAYAVVVHAALFVPVVVLGSIILWRSNLSMADLTRRSARQVALAEVAVAGPSLDERFP